MRRPLIGCLLALSVIPATAHGYRLGEVTPQPQFLYHVALDDWKKPLKRVVRALNRADVGVKLKLAEIPQQASIQIGRLERKCGLPGVDATTQTLQGGYAAIYLPRGCKPKHASILAAHELGHALGMLHDDRRCALMNSSGTGKHGIPTQCLGKRFDWLRKPFRKDDLKGLRKLFHNTAPDVTVRLTGPATVRLGTPVSFAVEASDKEDNLSSASVAYGDGETDELGSPEGGATSHTYAAPGTYTITATALDFYSKRGTASVTVTVTP